MSPLIQQRDSLTSGNFNHCSSVCHFNDGIMVAYYAGDNECADNQNVYLTFIRHQKEIDKIRMGNGTGNPVLWIEQNTIVMLYSKFEEGMYHDRLADKWKDCSLWVQAFTFSNDKIYFSSIPHRISSSDCHLLGRCKPLISRNSEDSTDSIILPLYDELLRCNVIYKGMFPTYKRLASYGTDMIQPTLWATDGVIHSASRNFNKTNKYSRHNSSTDSLAWSSEKDLNIYNRNSSLHAFTFDDRHFMIWNDTVSFDRSNLCIGEIGNDLSVIKIESLDRLYGSYPSVSVNNESIVITYTAHDRSIRITSIDAEQFRRTIDDKDRSEVASIL